MKIDMNLVAVIVTGAAVAVNPQNDFLTWANVVLFFANAFFFARTLIRNAKRKHLERMA